MPHKKLNRDIILYNINDAREELDRIAARIGAGKMTEPEFQIAMQHAFHHMNFAWNARHWPMRRYENLTQDDFDRAGSFPSDLAFED